MKLPYFRKPVRYVPSQNEGNLQDIRERIISILLISAITLGALAYIAAFFPALRAHQYGEIIIYSVCYAWILTIALRRQKLSYTVKIYSFLLLFYLLGLTNLLQNGLSADAGVFLLAFTIMSSLMIGARSGLMAILISLGTYALVGALMSSGNLVPPISTSYREPIDWLSGGAVLILLSTILALSLNIILNGLNESIAKGKTLAVDVDRDREQLRQRSQDLQVRLAQLRAAAEIEHTISAVLSPKDLLQKVVDLLGERFGLYYVGIFLLNDIALNVLKKALEGESQGAAAVNLSNLTGAEIFLQAGTGKIVPEGYKIPLTFSGTSGIGWAILNRKPRAVNISSRQDELIASYLPIARTELALPLLSHDHVIGALMIYSTQVNAFDKDDITLFQSSAESLAITLENARLFKQNQEDLEEIRALQRQYLNRTWAETEQIHGNLSYTYEAVAELQEQTADGTIEPSTYILPINLRDQTIGQFTMEADKKAWSNEDRAFIESVITEAALALENARLLDETQRRSNHDRLVADITQKVRASSDIETILSTAIRELGRNLQASEAVITLNATAENGDNPHPEDGYTNHPEDADKTHPEDTA